MVRVFHSVLLTRPSHLLFDQFHENLLGIFLQTKHSLSIFLIILTCEQTVDNPRHAAHNLAYPLLLHSTTSLILINIARFGLDPLVLSGQRFENLVDSLKDCKSVDFRALVIQGLLDTGD